MTLFKPTLSINKLVVTRNNNFVVDLKFHNGLNIIRGENSAGKTTLMRFLAYGLGSENIQFNQYASLCDYTIIEISCNEVIVTLKRDIETNAQKPLMIYWGALEQAVNAIATEWQIFPFRRSESKESFSQILFRLLEMPELRGESGANITMHQLLRLIYSDQETAASELFRSERFDPAITRSAVGDYLLGVDGNELYALKLEEGGLEKDLATSKGSIKAIYTTFGVAGTDINFDFLNERITSISHEIQNYQDQLTKLNNKDLNFPIISELDTVDSKMIKVSNSTAHASQEDDKIRTELYAAHNELSLLKQRSLDLSAEIADTQLFLSELEDRYQSLGESSAAEVYLGSALFQHCPSCFSEINVDPNIPYACPLCKSAVTKDSAKSQLARMRNELALQLKESTKIRADQIAELNLNSQKIPSMEVNLSRLEREFSNNRLNWRSENEIKMQNISRNLGAKEQELKNTIELTKLANLLAEQNRISAEIEARLIWVRGRIASVTREQTQRRLKAYSLVAENLKDLLHKDLNRQDEFINAELIDIDFAANKISIDGHFQFSASSMVYLKHSFHLALLLASTQDKSFRFPRLTLLDGIEDGGMEVERSFDLQRLIKTKSEETTIKHQIIIATSHICPELDVHKYIVGNNYTHEDKSIAIL